MTTDTDPKDERTADADEVVINAADELCVDGMILRGVVFKGRVDITYWDALSYSGMIMVKDESDVAASTLEPPGYL